MAYKVFLSHNSADYEHVKALASDATSIGVFVYLFEHDPQPGKPIAPKVLSAIRDSDALVAVLTAAGVASSYVQQEIGAAVSAGKLVIPIVEKGVSHSSLGMLTGIEFIVFDRTDLQVTRRSLVTYLDRLKRRKDSNWELGLAVASLVGLIIMAARE